MTVVDPENLWRSPELDCWGAQEVSHLIDGETESRGPEDMEGIIRSNIAGVRFDDELVRPGYPETQWQ
jgi:hypothetical protein